MRLSINNLGKKYNSDLWGLQKFNLEIDSGVVGILGPNGAGKSTLFRMLATITQPTTGQFSWSGIDSSVNPDKIRKQLGYLPQDFGIYSNLNAVEFLKYLAAVRGIIGTSAKERIRQLLDLVNLGESRYRKLGTMSGGMKQRVGIAQALLNDPQLLIVDEPTAGLDPEERIRFRNLIGELAGDRVVLLSSHIVSDIEAIASSITIISGGHLLYYDTPKNMLKLIENMVWEVEMDKPVFEEQQDEFIISSIVYMNEKVKLRLVGSHGHLSGAHQVTPSLEDAYLHCLKQKSNSN